MEKSLFDSMYTRREGQDQEGVTDSQEDRPKTADVLMKFRKYRPYLVLRLKKIYADNSEQEYRDDVDDIKYFLGVMGDMFADENHGSDAIQGYIARIHEMIRKNPLADMSADGNVAHVTDRNRENYSPGFNAPDLELQYKRRSQLSEGPNDGGNSIGREPHCLTREVDSKFETAKRQRQRRRLKEKRNRHRKRLRKLGNTCNNQEDNLMQTQYLTPEVARPPMETIELSSINLTSPIITGGGPSGSRVQNTFPNPLHAVPVARIPQKIQSPVDATKYGSGLNVMLKELFKQKAQEAFGRKKSTGTIVAVKPQSSPHGASSTNQILSHSHPRSPGSTRQSDSYVQETPQESEQDKKKVGSKLQEIRKKVAIEEFYTLGRPTLKKTPSSLSKTHEAEAVVVAPVVVSDSMRPHSNEVSSIKDIQKNQKIAKKSTSLQPEREALKDKDKEKNSSPQQNSSKAPQKSNARRKTEQSNVDIIETLSVSGRSSLERLHDDLKEIRVDEILPRVQNSCTLILGGEIQQKLGSTSTNKTTSPASTATLKSSSTTPNASKLDNLKSSDGIQNLPSTTRQQKSTAEGIKRKKPNKLLMSQVKPAKKKKGPVTRSGQVNRPIPASPNDTKFMSGMRSGGGIKIKIEPVEVKEEPEDIQDQDISYENIDTTEFGIEFPIIETSNQPEADPHKILISNICSLPSDIHFDCFDPDDMLVDDDSTSIDIKMETQEMSNDGANELQLESYNV